MIDTSFIMKSDTPIGKDPDRYSPTLRKYHSILWSKFLPSGEFFKLDLDIPNLLHHNSNLGEFYLSSDCIGHTYRKFKSLKKIINEVGVNEIKSFSEKCGTIGGYIIFPSNRINNQMTINGSRGCNHKIKDRFDLTLECIRRFYLNQNSPLTKTLERYSDFFNLFKNFSGYVNFFHLQDLVTKDSKRINFFLPNKEFSLSPLPKSREEYFEYKKNILTFIKLRNQRIDDSINDTVSIVSNPLRLSRTKSNF